MNNYDVIVIGAGNGGLAAAATLAEKGKKVIIFDKHTIPGGCGSSFRRGRFEFEIALHQLSHLGTEQNPGPLRALFSRYGILDKIGWIRIKELFRVNFPDDSYVSLPADRKECEKLLCEKFPSEKQNILKYFDTVYGFCAQSDDFAAKSMQNMGEPGAVKKQIMKFGFPLKYPLLAKYALMSAQDVLDGFFTDVKLKLVLSAYWCFMGVPPDRFPFSILAKCTVIYLENKPYYVKGTSMMVSQAITESVINHGGEVKFNCAVKKIIVENGRAAGVVDCDGNEYRAKKIISDISPLAVYGNLIGQSEVPQSARDYLKPYTIGISAITCFIGLDCPPEEIGFTTSFTLNYNSFDANRDFADAYRLLPENDPLVATCYTVDDESVSPAGTSIITAGVLKYGEAWEKVPAEKYFEMKYKAGERIVARLEKMYPGFREHIEEMEIATPLTHMRYLGHPHGAIYGYEQDLLQSAFFFPSESMIKDLEFVGGWVNACGFGPNYIYGDNVAQKIAREV